MSSSVIAVIDFGSQYTQLIVRRVRELGWYSKLYLPGQIDQIENPGAVILSGGPSSVRDANAPDLDFDWLRSLHVPVLGICYGMQLSNQKLGGVVSPGSTREYGPATLIPEGNSVLLEGLPEASMMWMSHSDTCTTLAPGARVLGKNGEGVPVAVEFAPSWFGIQFHPEVTHSEYGAQVLKNFLKLAGEQSTYTIEILRDELIRDIQAEARGREVVCGVSGGVDSTVLAVLLAQAGVKTHLIMVDHGLMRKNEAEEVVANFRTMGIEIDVVDASSRFLTALAGVTEPEKKRKIIGGLFIDVFFEAATHIEVLAQGTLYPDVIESASSGSAASKIKTHHNRVDRILELKKEGRVIEPLHELFKDEVRALGAVLGIPAELLNRHPFPGPGLAVRCPGEITEEKLAVIREADAIYTHELKASGWYDKIWQACLTLIPTKTVGVKGDERSYEYPVSLRAVISQDAMTADWVEIPSPVLRKISNRILNEVDGVNRVLYDISTKPPASIEWE